MINKTKKIIYTIINIILFAFIIELFTGQINIPNTIALIIFIIINAYEIYKSRHFIKQVKQYIDYKVNEALKQRKCE